ncbi:Alkaline phosphatase precursor [Luteitalea pratensis]|uniref:Alkaline phosphatase n=1 Tax=Luteitalea pratensis TaxID=1855912 RepID=A0A143PX72_LUTPR|nr:metallophosphoesterase family protein [Luteitalea pratensis]AMY12773.1 Alkaline phosphatase precursor [Luteitalea pratensis]
MPVRRLLHGVLLCVLTLGAWSMVAPAQAPIPVHSADPGRRPSRVVLTWRDDPARTQAVTWRTDALVEETFAEIVEASANPGSTALARRSPARTTAVPVPAGTAYYHEARFTALRPGTTYMYRVGDGGTWSEWFQFRTATVEPAAFSFIYLGDAEADVASLWSRAIRAAFADAPRARFVLHAGDLVNVGESDDQWGEWFGAGAWINGTVAQVPVVGNHEYGRVNREDPPQLTALWRPQFSLPEDGPEGLSETTYSFDYQGARVIVLNSAEDGRLADQAAWLESRLKDNKNRWTIVAFHHPVFSVAGDGDNAALRAAWKPLFDKYEVDLVLTGHDHTYGRGENLTEGGPRRDDAGTVYVVSVSGPKMFEVGKNRSWATRTGANLQLYQVVHVAPQSLRFEARTVSGQLFDAFEITKSRNGRRRFIDRKPELSGTY